MKYIDTICDVCKEKIKALTKTDDGKIYIVKKCNNTVNCIESGVSYNLLSTNSDYYKLSCQLQRKMGDYNYGIGIVEITQSCNIECSTCIAGCKPGIGGEITIEVFIETLKLLDIKQNRPDILAISGGEPTTHPQFFELLNIATKFYDHVIIISNGIDIAINEQFVRKISTFSNIEIYLQYDSIIKETLIKLRGHDLKSIREKAIENLEIHHIPTTLVSIVKKSINDDEISDSVNYALNFSCIRGITFQPIREIGRHNSFSKENAISLNEVSDILEGRLLILKGYFFKPHPLNPKHIKVVYFDKSNKKIVTEDVYKKLDRQSFFFKPKNNSIEFKYKNLFRILIVEYLDKYILDFEDLKYSTVGIIDSKGNIGPLEEHYIFNTKNLV